MRINQAEERRIQGKQGETEGDEEEMLSDAQSSERSEGSEDHSEEEQEESLELPHKRSHEEAEHETAPYTATKVKVIYRKDVSKPFSRPIKASSSPLPLKVHPKLSLPHEPYDSAKVRYMYGSPAPKVFHRPTFTTPKTFQSVSTLDNAYLDTFQTAADGVMSPVKPPGTESERKTAPSTPIFGGAVRPQADWKGNKGPIRPFTPA
jgi:hypothetical protein